MEDTIKDTSYLKTQDLSKLDVTKLTPETPEVISRQATINIGTIGHVAHGKTTVVSALTGINTVRFKKEVVRNITINLGYANAKIYRCTNPECPDPECWCSYDSSKEDEPLCARPGCGHRMKLVRHVSFVDCPGHEVLMATMLTGAAVMDAALLLIAANESCPQPQTREHLAAIEFMKLKHIIVLQNKIDTVSREAALKQYEDIVAFARGSHVEGAPILPISAQLKYNIDALCRELCHSIPLPVRDFTLPSRMTIIRSFDVNRPGTLPRDVRGGVAGGSIIQGVIRVGDEIEVRPGVIFKDEKDGVVRGCVPIFSPVVSLKTEAIPLQYAVPGGLIAVGTKMDPACCKGDSLVGSVLGKAGTLPNIYTELDISFSLLTFLLGAMGDDGKVVKVKKLEVGEVVMLNIGSSRVGATVLSVAEFNGCNFAKLAPELPICTTLHEKLALSRRINAKSRLIGWGTVHRGVRLEPHNVNKMSPAEISKIYLNWKSGSKTSK